MKFFTIRVFLEGGTIIDKLATTNDRDAHIQEYLARGVRTSDGTCLLIYPARLIQRLEVYEQGSTPPIPTKKAARNPRGSKRTAPREGDDSSS